MRKPPFRGIWPRAWRSRYAPGQLVVSIFLGVAAAIFLIHQLDTALRPQLLSLTNAKLRNQLTLISNEAVSDALAQKALRYSDIVIMEPGPGGGISTIATETVRLNDLRSAVMAQVVSKVESLDTHSLGVPLGALTGVDLFAGSGPALPVQVLSVASAEGSYRNDFTSAGINQTLHRVILDVTVTAEILLPGGVAETVVSTPVCVAETIIIGQVPQTYLELHQ